MQLVRLLACLPGCMSPCTKLSSNIILSMVCTADTDTDKEGSTAQHNTSHHNTSQHNTSHHITSHQITSNHSTAQQRGVLLYQCNYHSQQQWIIPAGIALRLRVCPAEAEWTSPPGNQCQGSRTRHYPPPQRQEVCRSSGYHCTHSPPQTSPPTRSV